MCLCFLCARQHHLLVDHISATGLHLRCCFSGSYKICKGHFEHCCAPDFFGPSLALNGSLFVGRACEAGCAREEAPFWLELFA